jgi:hypothetical protein
MHNRLDSLSDLRFPVSPLGAREYVRCLIDLQMVHLTKVGFSDFLKKIEKLAEFTWAAYLCE